MPFGGVTNMHEVLSKDSDKRVWKWAQCKLWLVNIGYFTACFHFSRGIYKVNLAFLLEKQICVSTGVMWAHVYTQLSKHEIQLNMIYNFGLYLTETQSVSVQIWTTCCVG